ncbi:MAG: YdcF family protein [Candidatus Pacebacteria bacterium]|nr:YdcF family protein [Candidatus Paceibacterota bacterium]
MNEREINKLALKIWCYHRVGHKLKKADLIMVMGSHDTRVAERGAEIFLKKYAPLIVFSGGLGNLTKGKWRESEANKFAQIALKMGVPKSKILIENQSTNTGENIILTRKLLKERRIKPKSLILVQKPYMERRAYATFKKRWPEVKLIVTSPRISFADYPNKEISQEEVINIIVGDLQRIKLYPQKGFQIYQKIPSDVWQAYQELVKAGYTSHLVSEN